MKFLGLCDKIIKKTIKNDIFTLANAVSFKFILGLFPFLIFLITLMGYFHLDLDSLFSRISPNIPDAIMDMLRYFVDDVVNVKSLSLLSTTLLLALYNASSGFHQMIKAINKAYNLRETRSFFTIRLISFLYVIVYTAIVIITMYGFVFGDKINVFLLKIKAINEIPPLLNIMTSVSFSQIVVFLCITLLYKFSPNAKISYRRIMPGVFFSMAAWYIISKLFNLYIDNFAKYSVVYGSIGTIFIFSLWINLLSYIVLFGAQINSVIKIGGKNSD